MLWIELAFSASIVAYGGACALFFAHLWRQHGSLHGGKSAAVVLGGAAFSHAAYVVGASLATNTCPIKSANSVLSFAGLSGTLIYLALCGYPAIRSLGAFLAPVALTFLLISRFLGHHNTEVSGGLLAVHIAANMIGVALFLLASAAAALYLVEERHLKQRRAGGLFGHLPPLDALDRAGHRFLLGGFPLLTLGIITGTVWAHKIQPSADAALLRTLFAYATWGLFAAVLVLRSVLGWRGRRAAYGTLVGFLFALVVVVIYVIRDTGTTT